MAGTETTDAAYVVHHQRLRETSLIVHCLTRAHGMQSMVARGVQGGKRSRHCVLEFTPLQLSWAGRANLPNLVRSEPLKAGFALTGERLLSALYLNELIMRFVSRGDANQGAFDAYTTALTALADDRVLEPILRRFEVALLDTCGYGLVFDSAADSARPLDPHTDYYYVAERGPLEVAPPFKCPTISGAALLCLGGSGDWTPDTARAAKGLMRVLLQYHLGGRELATRKLFNYRKPAPSGA